MEDTQTQSRRTALKNSLTANLNLEQGKLPPQAIAEEQAVLGALMLDANALNVVVDTIHTEYFYKPEHQKIFTAIYNLFSASQPVDILTVSQELKRTGDLDVVGGAYYVASLTNNLSTAAHIEAHTKIVQQKYIQRQLIITGMDITRKAFEETTDILTLLDDAESSLLAIGEKNFRKDYVDIHSLVRESIKEIEDVSKKEEGLSGVPSGFVELDRITSGWQKGTLLILAARPAMGKTAFALSMARNIAVKFKKAVAFFSLEMTSIELVTRLISSETGLSADKLKKGDLKAYEWTQLNIKVEELTKAPLYIDDTAGLTMFELRAKCRRLKQQHDISMIFVDYLQLMRGSTEYKGNREQEISQISRQLKELAKELKVPIFALSQLSRAVETRGGTKKPQLSDLRESGAIEQDADMVMFIYRPEYYKILEDSQGSTIGKADILIEKHRSGPTAEIRLRFIREYAKFENLDANDEILSSSMNDIGAGIVPNSHFETNRSVVTLPSSMNLPVESSNEDAPF